jgi:hypothetical protein
MICFGETTERCCLKGRRGGAGQSTAAAEPRRLNFMRRLGDTYARIDFNSVEVSPRLCRGTHPGLTYTAVARESPISARRRGFTHERVPESESYEVGL